MPTPQQKYRPALTEDALREIYSALPNGNTRTYIKNFLIKIGAGIVNAGYVTTPQNHTLNNLGFSSGGFENGSTFNSTNSSNSNSNDSEISSPILDDCLLLLEAYNSDPLSLTEAQIARVQSHRYANDMMTPEEEAEYLKTISL